MQNRFKRAALAVAFLFAGLVGADAQQAIGGGGVTPLTSCGDSGHALGWNGTAYICQAITGGSASAGGSNTQAQYNQAGALAGITGQTTDGTNTTFADGTLKLTGSSSGTAVLKAPATGGGTNTLPGGTDTLVNLTGTQTLTGKSISGSEINSGTVPAAQMPAFTGDVTTSAGSTANTLATVNAGSGSVGSSTAIPVFTTNAKGLVTSQSTAAVVAPAGTLTGTALPSAIVTAPGLSSTIGGQAIVPGGSTTNQGTGGKIQLSTGTTTTGDCVQYDANGNTTDAGAACGTGGGGGITALTGDIAAGPGSGSQAATLATVNSNTGACGDATHVCQVTLDGKGRATAASAVAITGGATFANPTATAGPTANNGSATTAMRSDASPAIQLGSASQKGILQVDGTTLTTSSGVASAAVNNVSISLAPGLTNTLGTCNATPVTSSNASIATQNCPVDYAASHTVLASEVGGLLNCTASGTACTFTLPAVNTSGFQHGEALCFMSSGSAGFILASASTFSGGPVTYAQNSLACVTSDVTNSVYKVNGVAGPLTGVTAISSELGSAGGSTLGIQSGGVSNAMLASGISATKVTTGTLPAAQLPAFTGDATSSAGTSALTLATVNSNVGTFGDATHCASLTTNAKGLITAASQSTSCPGAGGAASAASSGYSASSQTATAGTYFAPISGGASLSTTEATVSLPATSAATHVNLSVSISSTLGGSSTGFTTTLRKNGVDQALTCTFNPSAATACTDFNAGHSVSVAQSDVLDWKIVTAGTIVGTPTITIADNNGTTPGGVTSVIVTVPSRETATGCTITASGTCAITDNTQTKNTVFAGPASGSAAAPTFRALAPADQPGSWIDYVANSFYPIIYGGTSNGAAETASTIRWTPFYVDQSVTISNFIIRQGTIAGSTNVELAVYASNSSARPTGAALCSPAQQANTAANTNLTFACSAALTKGWYWLGVNQNDSTGNYTALAPTVLSPAYGVGVTALADMGTLNGSPTWTTTQTYGTWPTNPVVVEASAASNLTVYGVYQVASIP